MKLAEFVFKFCASLIAVLLILVFVRNLCPLWFE